MTVISPSRKDSEAQVRSWGFSHVFTWTDGSYVFVAPLALHGISLNIEVNSNAHYPPHSHKGLTTHLIRRGTLTITYPKDEKPEKRTFGVGDRVDVDAGKLHEVWMGGEGCEYVIGEM